MAIGNGTAPFAEAFVEELEAGGRKVRFPIVTDPARETYTAFEMKKTSMVGLLNPSVLAAGRRALSSGHKQTRTRGHAMQNGGVVVVNTDGEAVFSHIESHSGDLADLDEVIGALRALRG